ncbi:hypothetical protein A8E81_10680 [Burkholderia cenocepacia]|nr:hypothetical protein A8E75_30585 [Burkholderia cenocepacia]ONV25283.1 hypothetical protein A8E74_09665 [Burkholderia cenocepacia]ONV30593.1 hypothetical protein A8E78_17460 [Burkholderia cenocepacia]ONV33446.1 hypothetical protein A8E77_15830 [Burkholderia cenocepacia]ONV55297.1 hypothetical protein A8E81_10680 [Burkholderia cenocepacia]
MSDELKNDVDFARRLLSIRPQYGFIFPAKIMKDKEVIKAILNNYNKHKEFMGAALKKENRLGVAYEIIKEFPEYELLLGATLKKKIGSMSLVEYVEKKTLQKSLKKNLKNEVKPAMRTKI